jgi:hypothetical protein
MPEILIMTENNEQITVVFVWIPAVKHVIFTRGPIDFVSLSARLFPVPLIPFSRVPVLFGVVNFRFFGLPLIPRSRPIYPSVILHYAPISRIYRPYPAPPVALRGRCAHTSLLPGIGWS